MHLVGCADGYLVRESYMKLSWPTMFSRRVNTEKHQVDSPNLRTIFQNNAIGMPHFYN